MKERPYRLERIKLFETSQNKLPNWAKSIRFANLWCVAHGRNEFTSRSRSTSGFMDRSNEMGRAAVSALLRPSRRPPRHLFPISGLVAFNVTFARQITSKRASSPAQVCVSMCLAAPAATPFPFSFQAAKVKCPVKSKY